MKQVNLIEKVVTKLSSSWLVRTVQLAIILYQGLWNIPINKFDCTQNDHLETRQTYTITIIIIYNHIKEAPNKYDTSIFYVDLYWATISSICSNFETFIWNDMFCHRCSPVRLTSLVHLTIFIIDTKMLESVDVLLFDTAFFTCCSLAFNFILS